MSQSDETQSDETQSDETQSDEKWSGFLSRTVHELRTPLASILMLAEMAGDRRIHQATTDILKLLAEVSEYGKIEGGRIQVVEGNIEPAELVDKIERSFRPLAREHGIELAVVLHDDLPASVHGDRQAIERILSGLLGHVLRSADLGRVEVELRCEADGVFVVEIRDDGPVVPEEQRDTFFVPLLHARTGSQRQHGGQGLELAIAEALARRLGGELTLRCGTLQSGTLQSGTLQGGTRQDGEKDRGNMLTLRLPCVPASSTG